ncbi:MAG: LamG domain-containing protein [Saprospiraceae bacterium]
MRDLDYSFLRLRDNFKDAKDLSDSPLVDATLAQYTQIHLRPNETYFQISNSPTEIVFNDNYDAFLIDECGEEVIEITNNIFIREFTDTNAIKQISWEFLNTFDYYMKPLSIRLRSTVNGDSWYTNLFVTSEYNIELTTRFDYKSSYAHYGTQYNRADYYQSIRLNTYFRNKINESERSEYHQITTNVTVPQRNIKKIKERYLLNNINTWTNERIENMLINSEVYTDCFRTYSTTPIEFLEPELDSNFAEGEMILNKDYNFPPFEFTYQIFEGLLITNRKPIGIYTIGNYTDELKAEFNYPITINTGEVRIYSVLNGLIATYNESDLSLLDDNTFTSLDFTGLVTDNGDYYVHIDSTLFSYVGAFFEGINNDTDWTFSILAGRYDNARYDNSRYLVALPEPPNIDNSKVLFYKFNETSGTTATDSSGNSNDGTVVNALINQTGLIDKAYRFNNGATNQYVDIPASDSLSFGSDAFSIEVWIFPEANFGRILNKYNETLGLREYRLVYQSGFLTFIIYTDENNRIQINDNGSVNLSSWNQIIVTYDGSGNASGLKMKINNSNANGNQQMIGTFTGMPNTNALLRLGQESDNDTGVNRYPGYMDIFRIWKGYALSDAEITTLYNSGNGTEI